MHKRPSNQLSAFATHLLCSSLVLLTAANSQLAHAQVDGQVGAQAANHGVTVRVDSRVELMSIIFRLAGNPEYGQGRIEKYTADVEKQFGKHRNHRVIEMARHLRRTRGVSYDAVMSMAVHVVDTRSLKERIPFAPHPTTLDQRWRTAEAREFLAAARDFAKQTSFEEFVAAHQVLYRQTEQRLQTLLRQDAHLEWFEEFFGARPQAQFSVFVGLLNGGGCYGPRIRLSDGQEELHCVLGAWSADRNGDPQFDTSMLNTVIHEFCHSYANAIIDRHAAELKSAGEKLYSHVDAAMRRQAYGNWKTMMYESLVRACTIRYLRNHQGILAATKQTLSDKQRQFLWVGELSTLLGKYEKQRDQFEDLDEFAPQIVTFFDQYAEKFAKAQSQLSKKRPQVVTMMPTNGATHVDPSLAVLKVVFDRPMEDKAWSLVGGGPNFPKITGKPSYNATRKIWSVPVELKPNWSYRCMLNSDRFAAFRSQEGVPLEPVQVTFQTGPER